jgi:DNA polymerase-1
MNKQMDLIPRTNTAPSYRPPSSLPELGRYDRLVVDTETTGKNKHTDRPVGAALALPDGSSHYLPWAHRGGGNLDPALIRRWAKAELKGKTIVNLNTGFDVEMFLHFQVDLEAQGNRLRDIGHSAALLNEHRYSGFNLNSLAVEYLGPQEKKLEIDPTKIADMAAGEVAPYAEHDARLALRIDDAQLPLLKKDQLERVSAVEGDLIWVVGEMERNAARLDRSKLLRWRQEAVQKHQQAILEVYRLTGMKVNPNSPKDITALLKKLNLPSHLVTASGEDSIALENLRSFRHPVLDLCIRAVHYKSILSKYLDKYYHALAGGELLRFSLHQLRGDEYGTITGRFSSANVNIQQVMKVSKQVKAYGDEFVIRELFVPDQGFKLFSADASQIEYRLFADYSANPMLVKAYSEDPDTDFHDLTMKMIQRFNPECDRDRSKVGNFLAIYGGGDEAAAAQLNMSLADARIFMAGYHEAFPEARRLSNLAMRLAEQRGYVKTRLGRRRRYPKAEHLHSALNAVIQGTAADIMKLKLLELYRERKTLGIHKLRMTVHDEAVGDQDPDPKFTTRIKECLDRPCFDDLKVPILWDIVAGANWKECA